MNKSYLLLLISLLHISASAQEFSREFGSVSKAELEMTEYELDKEAEAVVLYDIGESIFLQGEIVFYLVFERTTRIKIFTEAGLDYAEVEIPYYREGDIYEKVKDIEAYTYNYENGSVTRSKLDTDNCYKEKINDNWYLMKFALPNVRPGSIVEYKYKLETQYLFNLQDWEFQRRIPTVYSMYKVKMVPFYVYTYLMQGVNKFDIQNSYEDRASIPHQWGGGRYNFYIHEYGMTDIPAFKDEAYITSINDHIIKIDFQLSTVNYQSGMKVDIMSTWPEMIKSLQKHQNFGRYITKSKKKASDLIDLDKLETMEERERFDYIINYVKENYDWSNKYGKYTNKTLKQFLDEGYGNVSEINLFAVGLLKAAGIDAYPVISSTRGHGTIKADFPLSSFFNYVLIHAKIGEKILIADATEVFTGSDRIPTRALNDKGLIVDGDGSWLTLPCHVLTKSNTIIRMDVSEESIVSDFTISSTEYDAVVARKEFGDKKSAVRDIYIEDGYEVNDSSIRIENFKDIKKPFKYRLTAREKTDMINDKIYISPFLQETMSENPLKQPTRRYPIDIVFPYMKSFSSLISIPDGYQLNYKPENSKITNKLFELSYMVLENENTISVNFAYSFKKPIYAAADYQKIKYYINEIVKKGNEKIVLEKIEEEVVVPLADQP